MYNKNKIQAEIKNQILKKYQIDLKFNEKIDTHYYQGHILQQKIYQLLEKKK